MTKIKLPSHVQCLLFDMDGTLVDTEPVGPQNFVNQLAKHSIETNPDEIEFFTNIWRRMNTKIGTDEYLAQTVERYQIDMSVEDYIKEFYELYVVTITDSSQLIGADHFIKAAKASGKYKMAIVTASKLIQVHAVLERHNWGGIFDLIVSEENIINNKPDPQPFNFALEKLRVSSNDAIVFEDSKNGSAAGAAAGCYVIGLSAGNVEKQDLSKATVIVDSFNDISID